MIKGPDKVVQDVLNNYVNDVLFVNDSAWEKILDGEEADFIEKFRDNFRANPPTIKLGYARQNDAWPLWAIVLLSDTVTTEFLNKNEKLIMNDIDKREGEYLYSMYTEQEVGIIVYAENPDVARIHSQIACGAILASCHEIVSAGIDNYLYGGMQDLEPQSNYLPETIWARIQSWKFMMKWHMPAYRRSGIIVPPAYVGISGSDFGDGHIGKVDPNL